MQKTQALHFIRALAKHTPELTYLLAEISKVFRSEEIAIHRLRDGRKSEIQPLGTNSENEMETKGMFNCLRDFETQMGYTLENMKGTLIIPHGDGGSIAAIHRLKKSLVAHGDEAKSFETHVTPGPAVWHTRSTRLGSIVFNHFGPIACSDPSALAKSFHAINVKRPSDLSKPDFYPTSEAMILIWEARVLDIWR